MTKIFKFSVIFTDNIFFNNTFMEKKTEFQLDGATSHINQRNMTMWVLEVPQLLLW